MVSRVVTQAYCLLLASEAVEPGDCDGWLGLIQGLSLTVHSFPNAVHSNRWQARPEVVGTTGQEVTEVNATRRDETEATGLD